MQQSTMMATSDEEMKQTDDNSSPRDEHKALTTGTSAMSSTFDHPSLPLPTPSSTTTPLPSGSPRVLPPLPSSPAVIILRGVSGSGKSSIAKHYQTLALAAQPTPSASSTPSPPPPRSLICSADSFFLRNGRYMFDSKLLSQAHSACLAAFLALLAARAPYVIVDNTNIQRWEYDNYTRIAALLGYAALIVAVEVRGEDELRQCGERNVHEVSYAACQSMADRWEEDSRAVRVRPEWTEEDRRRMALRKAEREQAKLRWQTSQQMRAQQPQQPGQQQLLQSVQHTQQRHPSPSAYFHTQPHHHNNSHYQPYPHHRPNSAYHITTPHYPNQPPPAAAAKAYRDDRGGGGRGRGRGGWRGGGIGRGGVAGRGGGVAQEPVPLTAASLTAATSTPQQSAPAHTIRWVAKQPAEQGNSFALVSAPIEPNKRYVIDDTPF